MFDNFMKPSILLMNKLPFKYKIFVSTFALFILLILPSKTVFVNYIDKTDMYNNQLIGITYIKNMQKLIQDIQLHRGMINAYLNGDKDFKDKIIDNENTIDKNINKLINLDKKNLNILNQENNFINALSNLIVIKLENISTKDKKSDIFNSHCKIIANIIETIHYLSKVTKFSTSSDLKVNYIAHLLEEKLLLLQENTGQIRGLAVGVFSKNETSDKLKSKIFSSYTLIKSLEKNLLDNKVLTNIDNYFQIQKATVLVTHKLDEMLNIIYKNIIISDKPSYDNQTFFLKATDAINEQIHMYNLLADNYKVLVNDLKTETYNHLLFTLLGLIVILLSSLYLFGTFYHSIVGSLKKLEMASNMIASGKTNIRMDVDTKDELGNAILSFNYMSKKLDKNISFLDGYKMAIDEASIVSKTNSKGIITYVNKKFCQLSGYSEQELIGMPHNLVRHPDVPKAVFKDLWETIKDKKIWKGVVKNRTKDGGTYIVDATIIPVVDSSGNLIEYIGIRHDVTELERSKEEILKQKIDHLTGLSNKNQLVEDMNMIKKPILLYLNIDDFASLNDFYGSKIGDDVLIYLSKLLKRIFKKDECKYYKLHNDEFALLFNEDLLPIDKAQPLISKIISYIEKKTIECDSKSCISITLSGSIASYTQTKKFEELISFVTIARRVAKSENKKFLLYNQNMNKESDYKNNIEWINRIKEAIEQDKIVAYFQPIIDNSTGAVTKYESLVRMIDSDGKPISPFFFLDIAKKANIYTSITKIVIDKTFEKLQKMPYYDFSINLTIEDINDKDVCKYIFDKLKKFKFSEHIIFEITESEKILDYSVVNEFINVVKGFGVKIAIDDFGSGYANFEHIIGLNADFIKIDGSLIKDIDKNKEAYIITEAIIAFSKKIGSKTVVEYVHSESVYETVKKLGADFSQGFYLGEPAAKISTVKDMLLTDSKS
jgi:PAS domain S-box-containing protein/diguanylate cyclase (GGDEF)-like protein